MSGAFEFCWTVIALDVAEKGPTVSGAAGNASMMPSEGIVAGRVWLKSNGPSDIVAGVAPVMSNCAVAEPSRFGWRA